MSTLYISKSFASESDAAPQTTSSDDRITASSAPSQIRLASGSLYGIEDIFLDLGANNYAPSQIQLNFLASRTFEETISLLDKPYSDPRQAIASQSPVLNSIGSGSILFPKGTSLEQVTNAFLSAYPDYKAIPVYNSGTNQATPDTGEVAYIYFRKRSNNVTGTVATSTTPDLHAGIARKADIFVLTDTPEFGAGTADSITNFNPKEKDRLQIQLSQFGADGAGTFKVAKNPKALSKALATSTDFVYLKSRGELYYNENGKQSGFGDGGIFAVLEGNPTIRSANIGFI